MVNKRWLHNKAHNLWTCEWSNSCSVNKQAKLGHAHIHSSEVAKLQTSTHTDRQTHSAGLIRLAPLMLWWHKKKRVYSDQTSPKSALHDYTIPLTQRSMTLTLDIKVPNDQDANWIQQQHGQNIHIISTLFQLAKTSCRQSAWCSQCK